MCVISEDYRKINQQLVGKPHPLPIIAETMQILEELRYDTDLDLNIELFII